MKKAILTATACIGLLAASSSFAALEGPAGYRADRGNTAGWGMMSRAERAEHRKQMQSFKTESECRAYQDQHRKLMEERAQQRGRSLSAPRHDACSMMKSRGRMR